MITPESVRKSPQIALNRVDLPAPLEPMIVAKSPFSKFRDKSLMACFSFTVPGMTIEENLALAAGKGGWLSHVSRQEKERFHEELKLLDIGLEKRMTQPVGLLSGGQRQALTLLMATMNPPKLLLLDEHTAALDPGTAEKVLNLTKRIVEEHQLTCLMITHNMQSALDLGNRILMMDSGDIVLDIHEEEKKGLTVEGLLEKFKTGAGKMLDNDRILLSGEK